MTDFETASAKYHKAKAAYWKAESALAAARHDLTIAERERSAAFDKEVNAARSRNAVGNSSPSTSTVSENENG
jgi:hypothetical protein